MQWELPEGLAPLLIFGAIVVFNTVVPWMRRWLDQKREELARRSRTTPSATEAAKAARAAQAHAAQAAARAAAQRPARAPAPDVPTELIPVTVLRPPPVNTALAPAARTLHRSPVRELIAGRERLREAIIVSTVLGPCRALDPHEPGD